MGLFSVLGTSSFGLKSIQDQLSLVSQNVAGANTDGYVRRVLSQRPDLSGSSGSGTQIERALDRFVQMGFFQAKTGSGFSNALSEALTDVNNLFGAPGAESGLPSLLSKFQNALKSLVADPASSPARTQVVGQLNLLVNSIHGISDGIQSIRANIESGLSDRVGQLNSYIQEIDSINKKLIGATENPGLRDQRDVLVGKISELVGVNVREEADGMIQITTDTGLVLLDQSGPAKLSFDAKGNVTANDLYDVDPSKRRVGTILATTPGGTTVDLLANGLMRSGELGALVKLRDQVLVEAQGQIDDFAAALSSAFSDESVDSTSIAGGRAIDLADLKSGNRVHVSYTDSSGKVHRVAFVPVKNASYLPLPSSAVRSDGETVIGIDQSGGINGMISAMQSGLDSLGAGLTLSAGAGQSVNFVATTPASLTALSATVTNASVGANSKGLALFTDGSDANSLFTDHYDGASQRIGFASRISLNPLVKTDATLLVTWGDSNSPSSNLARANSLLSRFTSNQMTVSTNSPYGLADGKANVTDILNQFIQYQSLSTSDAVSQNSGQSVTLKFMEAKFKSTSGVNIDSELASMTALQAAYTANARVMTTARDMLDVLMRM